MADGKHIQEAERQKEIEPGTTGMTRFPDIKDAHCFYRFRADHKPFPPLKERETYQAIGTWETCTILAQIRRTAYQDYR